MPETDKSYEEIEMKYLDLLLEDANTGRETHTNGTKRVIMELLKKYLDKVDPVKDGGIFFNPSIRNLNAVSCDYEARSREFVNRPDFK